VHYVLRVALDRAVVLSARFFIKAEHQTAEYSETKTYKIAAKQFRHP
jgi:hypothetical protein